MTRHLVSANVLVMEFKQTEIGMRLKEAREKAGITPNALSLKMYPSPGRAWAGWVESGRIAEPSIEALRRAAEVLGISDEWLICGIGQMHREAHVA